MSVDQFKAAEDEFARLRGDLTAGRLTLEQFHNALKQGKVRDSLGREWAVGAETGKWYVREGGRWVQSDPFETGQTATPPSPVQIEQDTPSTPPINAPLDVTSDTVSSSVSAPIATPNATPSPATSPAQLPIRSRVEAAPSQQPRSGAELTGASAASGRRPSRTRLYLLVVILGMCAILLALVAAAVILAASRGYY